MARKALPDHIPSVFSAADCKQLSISKRNLYTWRDQGLIETLGRGLFMQTGIVGDQDMVEIAVRAPGATLCLSSALSRHGLSDQILSSTHVAIERMRRAPATKAPVIWHHFDEGTFQIDRNEFEVIKGISLGVYGPTRCVIDAFRLRHREGEDAAIVALRRWLRKRGNHPSALLEMVQHFPVAEKSISTALKILL